MRTAHAPRPCGRERSVQLSDCASVRFGLRFDTLLVFLAQLRDPRWPWHAAAHLGGHVRAPEQYLRSQPRQYRALFDLTGSAES